MDRFEQIVAELVSLYSQQLTFWDRGKIADLSDDDLLDYDFTSQRIERLRNELESLVAHSKPRKKRSA